MISQFIIFALMRVIFIASVIVCCGLGLFIFYIVVTGRGETSTPVDTSAYEIRGADLSSHNGDIDFDALKSYGLDFVYLKATEGGDFKDKSFARNIKQAFSSGLVPGAYHFFRFDTPGYIQALNVLSVISGRNIKLPVVIDVEEWSNPRGYSTEHIIREIRNMAEVLESEGYEVMLYTNKDGYNRFIKNYLNDYPLWLCSFRPIDGNIQWSMWQYTHRGIIKGIERLTDLNVWKGSRAIWDSLYVTGNNSDYLIEAIQ